MFSYISQLEAEARDAAKEFHINDEKRDCFIKGAKWAVEKLRRITDVHPMEEMAGANASFDKIRLKDVHKFLDEMLQSVKSEDDTMKENKWNHLNLP